MTDLFNTLYAFCLGVLDDAFVPGFQTPSTFLGPDFVLSLDGVVREDIA